MKAIQHAELGLALVSRATDMSPTDDVPAHSLLTAHLDASRQRLERWSERFRSIASSPAWRLRPAIVHELLVSEILVRTTAAVARLGMPAVSPIFEHLVTSHAIVRRQVHQLLKARRLWLKQFQVIAHRSDRWTDMLLGNLVPLVDVADLGLNKQRVLDYADNGPLDELQSSLLRNSLVRSLQTSSKQPTGHETLNERIACSFVSCLPARIVRNDEQLNCYWRPAIEVAMTIADEAPILKQHPLRN